MVQLGSNGGRMAMTWRHIDMRRLLAFLPGVALGALVAAWVLIRLPEGVLELSIALFVLFTCWGPALPKRALSRTGTLIAGAITTFLSSLIGASGPLVASFIKQGGGERHAKVATFAACMVAQHLTKAFIFGMAGFLFQEWLPLIVLMIGAGLIGTRLGLRFLDRVSNRHFDGLFKWALSLLALRLAWLGSASLISH
ncbi:MAG: permease [Cobetia sp.]|nr:sulfite exporter TauE/SafE family protein [Cobetia sp.]MBF10132.1 permease [Cobetia sp.]MBK09791.1 permease [Cobetia sp.]|tara:strand:+ start:21 stop:611 length:591 start_codon:yes stop_codon:yes gene_type:complete